MAALAAQLHLALVDDHLGHEGARVADALTRALSLPRLDRGDLAEIAEGVLSVGTGEPELPAENHKQRVS